MCSITGRSEKRPVRKVFWRLTPARAPGWALNAQKGQQMGVKRQNGYHSGRLMPERWGDQDFVFKSNFFKLSFSYPYFSTKIHFNLSSFTFKFSKSKIILQISQIIPKFCSKTHPSFNFFPYLLKSPFKFFFFSKSLLPTL